jgi:outer membrane protein
MKTLNFNWSVGLVLAALACSSLAQESRVAYISTQRITAESAPAKAATAKLEQEFAKLSHIHLFQLQLHSKSLSIILVHWQKAKLHAC